MTGRLARVELTGEALSRLSPAIEADRTQAVRDLLHENRFLAANAGEGPYALHLSITEGRLAFDIRDAASDAPLSAVILALGPFRGLIKDYLMMVDAHVQAVADGGEARVQAIDMGRRGLHNEAAELLMQRLAGKIEIDFDTARRLFTLVAVLHQRG
jgi:uncharacterized protein (UPF0262 family)